MPPTLLAPRYLGWVLEQDGMCISLSRARDMAHGSETCALPVLDGLPIDDKRLGLLDPETITAVAVLQPMDARILYGTRGDHGAVLFFTKARAR